MAPIININEEGLAIIDSLKHPGIRYTRVQSASSTPLPSQSSSSQKPQKSKKPKESNYILLDREHQNGNYSKVDLLVPFKRTHLTESWSECRTPILLANEQGYMPTIRQHLDFLELIKSGEAFDENGNKIDSKRLQRLFDEITAPRNYQTWEWLDAKFIRGTITYHSIEQDGSVKEIAENLDDCLMEDKNPGISLDSWLKTANSHGMPTENTQDGSFCYLFPRGGWAVAYFSGNCLICIRDPDSPDDSLGVRVTKIKW